MTYNSNDPHFSTERSSEWSDRLHRFGRYLASRNIECWGFFIAGLMIGGIFL